MRRRIEEGARSMGLSFSVGVAERVKAPRHLPGEASFRVKLKRNPRTKRGGTA
jgi:hypothetical protein